MRVLNVYMNGIKVGELEKVNTGAHVFTYTSHWLDSPLGRPISLSMPLRGKPYKG